MSAAPMGSKGTRSSSTWAAGALAGPTQRLGQPQPGEGPRRTRAAGIGERGPQALGRRAA